MVIAIVLLSLALASSILIIVAFYRNSVRDDKDFTKLLHFTNGILNDLNKALITIEYLRHLSANNLPIPTESYPKDKLN